MFSLINPKFLKQTPGEKPYRWLRDSDIGFDIFFWQNDAGQTQRFQIWGDDHLWEWNAGKGWKFGLSDPQKGSFSHYQAPTYRYARQKYLMPLAELQKSITESLTDNDLRPFLALVLQHVEILLADE